MTRQIRAANAAYLAAVARAAHPPLGEKARTLRDAQRACLAGLQLAAAVPSGAGMRERGGERPAHR